MIIVQQFTLTENNNNFFFLVVLYVEELHDKI